MKTLWCWRCKMEVPMLEGEEATRAYELYGDAFNGPKKIIDTTGSDFKTTFYTINAVERDKRIQTLLDYYKEITGETETNPNAIMHHMVDLYGPPCEKCGKPYRTKQASFCAACGNKRTSEVTK
jgi:hypothetical protein